jgi:DNA-binding CsgD family transcriptional regulator
MPGKRQKAFEMHLQRKPTDEIAKALQVSEYTVVTWIREEWKAQNPNGAKKAHRFELPMRSRGSTSPKRSSLQIDGTVRKKEARRMAQNGAAMEKIAKHFGVHKDTVWLWTNDIYRERRLRLRERVRRMARNGATAKQISSELGINESTLRNWADDALREGRRENDLKKREPARRMARNGATAKQIALKLGVTDETVYKYAGDILRENNRRKKKEARRLVKAGVPRAEIASRLSIHRRTVTEWTKDVS